MEEVAKAQGKDGLDCFLDLSLEEDLETRFVHMNTQGDPQGGVRNPQTPVCHGRPVRCRRSHGL